MIFWEKGPPPVLDLQAPFVTLIFALFEAREIPSCIAAALTVYI